MASSREYDEIRRPIIYPGFSQRRKYLAKIKYLKNGEVIDDEYMFYVDEHLKMKRKPIES